MAARAGRAYSPHPRLVDQLGSVGDALDYLHQEIERRKQPKAQTQSDAGQ